MDTKSKAKHTSRFKLFLIALLASLLTVTTLSIYIKDNLKPQVQGAQVTNGNYWLELHRKSGKENLYYGIPGDYNMSTLIKVFDVKPGVPGKKPTPLPQLLGRSYWLITKKEESSTNPETSPYFLTLDIPTSEKEPFGPKNYNECNGSCDWEIPGYFGLHGVGGNPEKVSANDPGSSGCVRHKDEDIVYLYNLLEVDKSPVRYYIQDN